jgi:tripartite-type tricarboxylate transporter receptor subunit TctC
LASCAALVVAVAIAVPAAATDYPDHAVRVIVPFAAGGPTDVMARPITQRLSENLTMQGIFVPAGTPPAVVELLNREIVKVMQLPDVKAKCLELGFDVVADSPADFAVYIKNDIEKWAKVINDAKIEKIK